MKIIGPRKHYNLTEIYFKLQVVHYLLIFSWFPVVSESSKIPGFRILVSVTARGRVGEAYDRAYLTIIGLQIKISGDQQKNDLKPAEKGGNQQKNSENSGNQ